MPQFLHHENIKKELLNLFKEAEEILFLVSPFIQLSEEMKRSLSRKKNDVAFEIVVLFGKNEHNLSKSLSREDMEFLSNFKMYKFSIKQTCMQNITGMKRNQL